jgi:hypothetical protein
VKMPLAKKPRYRPTKSSGSGLRKGRIKGGLFGLAHYNYYKAGLLPIEFPSVRVAFAMT